MHMQIELWELGSLLAAFFGMLVGGAKLLLMQIEKRLDERFTSLENMRSEDVERWREEFASLDEYIHDTERNLMKLRTELPNEYVRREDWIRFSGKIDASLDRVHEKLDNMRADSHE